MRTFSLLLVLAGVQLAWPSMAWGQRFAPPPIRAPVFHPAPHFFTHPVGGHAGRSDDSDWPWILGGCGAVAVLALVVYLIRNGRRVHTIRIVATPPGEAPEAVRGAWVGLELPLASGETGLRPLEQIEVISLRLTGKAQGYLVDSKQALAILADQHPEAAAWWHDHCAAALASRAHLAFPPEVCEPISGFMRA